MAQFELQMTELKNASNPPQFKLQMTDELECKNTAQLKLQTTTKMQTLHDDMDFLGSITSEASLHDPEPKRICTVRIKLFCSSLLAHVHLQNPLSAGLNQLEHLALPRLYLVTSACGPHS